ncbi:uncharacterized protein LY89DRAFT_45034 [Mollisia scopiformis]|uniref:Uncharacterized protein n=1 Tax=Mollisia scopiformis TaxID=149040 RepID=A0A194XDR0_MOLSC|nr:uncharacterized protein LY89DRAFT_45034 [Mollisia scopiformis]KUJ18289.1 hypothetical protein LY89DRAFT_45034 [Mollisia scopiformis]
MFCFELSFSIVTFSYPNKDPPSTLCYCYFCLQNTPYRLHEISLRERRARLLHSAKKSISFVMSTSVRENRASRFGNMFGVHILCRTGIFPPVISVQFTEDSGYESGCMGGWGLFLFSGETPHPLWCDVWFWFLFGSIWTVGWRSISTGNFSALRAKEIYCYWTGQGSGLLGCI